MPQFLFDINSPYAYLAAARIDQVLPVRPHWQPVAFAFILRHSGRRPWSFSEHRSEDLDEISRRARARGLPTVRYPERWPVDCYSLDPLRAVICAARHGCERAVAMALFNEMFVRGRALDDRERVVAVAARAGEGRLEPRALADGMADEQTKLALQRATEQAIADGVPGVPVVQVGRRLYWGDDRLEDAAADLTADGHPPV